MITETAVHHLSATELLDLYRRKALSPVEVTKAVLARIAHWEPSLQATYALDPEAALAEAGKAEVRWGRGEPIGALDGVPVMIKENIATKGVAVPIGTAATELKPAAADAPPAARLREAVTRVLHGLESGGLIAREGKKVILLDRDRLHRTVLEEQD